MKRFIHYLIVFVFLFSSVSAQSDPFFFIQITDPQLGMQEKNEGFSAETKIMEQVIVAINKLEPAFVVVTGDMVNAGNDQSQIQEFKRICGLIKKDIPLYVLPGNHDLCQQASDKDLQNYMDEYGYDCFSFQIGNTRFIGLNTPVIFAGRTEQERSQRIWMEKVLENSQKCDHRILFGHYPFFLKDPDEANRYENIPLEKRKIYLELMDKYKVGNMFAGHLHYNLESSYHDFKITTTNSVCTPLGKDRIGLRVVRVYSDKVVSDYYELDRIPSKIVL